jgi:MFS family permease
MNVSLVALDAVNFFVADVQDGLGPYLGVFLQQQHWSPTGIGVVMTIGGLAGMAATTPLGALVDRVHAKRLLAAVATASMVLGSLVIFFIPGFWATVIAQTATGIAGASLPPAIAGITLGLVGQGEFTKQMGRIQAFNHAGNVAAALLCGGLGYAYGLGAVFAVMAGFAVLSLAGLYFIDPRRIDYDAARGASGSGGKVQGFSVLLRCKPLIVLSATLLLFHLGNAAMLPLLGQALVAKGANPSAYTSATIVIAQLTMIPMSLLAAWLAGRRGYWLVFVLALLALPVRGVIAAMTGGVGGLIPVQVLDGVGAGLLSVAVPGLVARIMAGTGRVNVALGAVMTVQGIGAALSTTLGGAAAESYGYPIAFIVLGCCAVVALAVWSLTTPLMAEACGIGAGPALGKTS